MFELNGVHATRTLEQLLPYLCHNQNPLRFKSRALPPSQQHGSLNQPVLQLQGVLTPREPVPRLARCSAIIAEAQHPRGLRGSDSLQSRCMKQVTGV
jgi:hypothetical protein